MRGSNDKIKNQYYPDLTRSNYTSTTSRKLKSQSHQDLNDTQIKFYNRLEKACPTLSNADIKKEFNLYRREIERLEKEILKKDKIVFDNKAIFNFNKELEAELIETYRIIYLYEGKMTEFQRELKRLQLFISQKMQGDLNQKVEELLQSYRKGQVQQKNRLIFELQSKIRKLQNKYFSTSWKLSSTKRQILNPLKLKFPNLRNTITIKQSPLIQKQKEMNENLRLSQKLQARPNILNNDYQNNQAVRGQSLEGRTYQNNHSRDSKPIVFKRIQGRPINIEYGYSNNLQQQNKIIELGGQNKGSKQTISLNSSMKTINNDQVQHNLNSSQKRVYASPINRYEINNQFTELQQMMKKTGQVRYSQATSNRLVYHH